MFAISWVIDLAHSISDLLLYVVPGYLFLSVYRYILYKDRDSSNQVSYLLFLSIIISFVLKSVYQIIPFVSEHNSWYLVSLLAFSLIVGYVSALLVNNPAVNNFRMKMGIMRNTKENIWDDVISPGLYVRVWINDGYSYYGQIKYSEDYEREPIIVLCYYQMLGPNQEIIFDNTDDDSRMVMLNLKNFERIEMVSGD